METSESVSLENEEEDQYINDLQLAAKLGQKLLVRNSDLEETLKQQEEIIDECYNEIKFLTQQSKSFKEVSDSRILVYEQLEITVLELEKTNQKLLNESYEDKIRFKRIQEVVRSLELKCEDLQRTIHSQKEKEKRIKKEISKTVCTFKKAELMGQTGRIIEDFPVASYNSEDLQLRKLKYQISKLSSQLCAEQKRFEALEAQTVLVLEESVSLKEQVQTLQAQKEKNDFFQQNQRICLVCRNTRFQYTLERFPSNINSETSVSLEAELGRMKHKMFNLEAPNKRNVSMALIKAEDLYDSGCEDLSLTSTASCNTNSTELDSQKIKSLYEELMEVDEQVFNRWTFNDSLETDFINQEVQTELSGPLVTEYTKGYVNQEVQTERGNYFEEGGQRNPPFQVADLNVKNDIYCPERQIKEDIGETVVVKESGQFDLIDLCQEDVPIQKTTTGYFNKCSYQEEKSSSSIELKSFAALSKSDLLQEEIPSEKEYQTSIFQILRNAMLSPNFFSAGPSFSPKTSVTSTCNESEAPSCPRIRRKKYKSIFMRTPFFTIPSKTLFSGPLLKIGLPFAATQAEVLSNAFKYCS